MSSRRQRHQPSTYHSGSTSRSAYRSDRGNNQGRMNDFSYETRGHRPSEYYFDEHQRRGSSNGEYHHPADYYSGRGGYAQDRYENSSRGDRSQQYGRRNEYGQQNQYGQQDQYRDQFDRYNRDHEQRYFDEDYEGNRGLNRGFNRNYNMNSDYRRPYDEEHRAFEREETPQRMGQSWEGMDFENPGSSRSFEGSRNDWQDESYRRSEPRGRGNRNSRDIY